MQNHHILECLECTKRFSPPVAKFGPVTERYERVTMADRVLCRGQWRGGCRSRKTNLGVGTVLLLAFPTGEEVGLRPSCLGHLMLPDCFFRHGFSDLLQLVTGHFLPKKAIKSHLSSFTTTPTTMERVNRTGWPSRQVLLQKAVHSWFLVHN